MTDLDLEILIANQNWRTSQLIGFIFTSPAPVIAAIGFITPGFKGTFLIGISLLIILIEYLLLNKYTKKAEEKYYFLLMQRNQENEENEIDRSIS